MGIMIDMIEIRPSPGRWTRAPQRPALTPGDTHLWMYSLAASEGERESLRKLLNADEKSRAARMRLEQVRDRFEVAHARLRQILARYTGTAPAELMFTKADGGKPHLGEKFVREGIQFSLSHSGDAALVGISLGHAIGVDIEIRRATVDIDLVARRQFAPGEVERIFSTTGDARAGAFYACWTRKEAYLKARGEGLIGRLQDFEVSCLPKEPPELQWTKSGDVERTRWELIDVPVGDGAAAACVVERPVGPVSFYSL